MTQEFVLQTRKREGLAFESLNRDLIARILGTVVYSKAFFFYEDIGKPTGDFAVSLSDFGNKINKVTPKCLAFHLKRADFENWIREIVGDTELSNRIGKLRTDKKVWKKATMLRSRLYTLVRDRVSELRDLWRHALTWP